MASHSSWPPSCTLTSLQEAHFGRDVKGRHTIQVLVIHRGHVGQEKVHHLLRSQGSRAGPGVFISFPAPPRNQRMLGCMIDIYSSILSRAYLPSTTNFLNLKASKSVGTLQTPDLGRNGPWDPSTNTSNSSTHRTHYLPASCPSYAASQLVTAYNCDPPY